MHRARCIAAARSQSDRPALQLFRLPRPARYNPALLSTPNHAIMPMLERMISPPELHTISVNNSVMF
jgi:hypothetical protein